MFMCLLMATCQCCGCGYGMVCWAGLGWIGLDWIEVDWTGLDWIELDGLDWGWKEKEEEEGSE